jgi:hypothetical protein
MIPPLEPALRYPVLDPRYPILVRLYPDPDTRGPRDIIASGMRERERADITPTGDTALTERPGKYVFDFIPSQIMNLFHNFVGITVLQVFHLLNHHIYYRSFLMTCNARGFVNS